MRSIITASDVRDIIDETFNGNLWKSKVNSSISYVNNNSEKIIVKNEDESEQIEQDLAEYLNISFYAWKERVENYTTIDSWVESLNLSLNKSYALVELIDEEATASQDIDNATKQGRITFFVQTNKVQLLDYYVNKIRNNLFGVPQLYQNAFGKFLKMFFVYGILIYDEEPITTQLGECIKITCNFSIAYLNNAYSYADTHIEFSLHNADSESERVYKELPIIKMSREVVVADNALPMASRPDITGFQATTISTIETYTFYDFANGIAEELNDLFWLIGSRYNDTSGLLETSTAIDVNIPIFVRVTSNGKTYVYKNMLSKLQKVLTNGEFNISSMTIKGWGKVF